MQVSPFRALYGYNPRWIISITSTDPKVQGVKKRLKSVRKMRALMAQNWEKATACQAANYNKKYNYRIFKRGISGKCLTNPSGLLKTLQAHKIGQCKWLTPDYQFGNQK